jgi:DNA transformation protein and related proteins
MPSSASFRAFVIDQLGRVVPRVRSRPMFGGFGIYAGDLFFALIADDTLYFKVDDSNRPDYEALGLKPFQPYGPGSAGMKYFQVPAELLDEPEALKPWAEKAITAARNAKRK